MTIDELNELSGGNIKESIEKLSLSEDQRNFINIFCKSLNKSTTSKGYIFSNTNYNNTLVLHGYAGTGKTTLVKHLVDLFPELEFSIMTFTGKASQVLAMKNIRSSTIHRNIYQKVEYEEDTGRHYILVEAIEVINGKEVLKEYKEYITDLKRLRFNDEWVLRNNCADLGDIIIIDECSMIGKDIYNDLKLIGLPVILVGDPGQLPPVSDEALGNLNADYTLVTNFRQGVGNPITDLSVQVRNGNLYPNISEKETYNEGQLIGKVKVCSPIEEYDIFSDHPGKVEDVFMGVKDETLVRYSSGNYQILVGTNNKRVALNSHIRQLLNHDCETPKSDEKLIVLCNNYNITCFDGHTLIDVVNGMQIRINGLYKIDRQKLHSDKFSSIVNNYTGESCSKDDFIDILRKLGVWNLTADITCDNKEELLSKKVDSIIYHLYYMQEYFYILEFEPIWCNLKKEQHSYCLIPKCVFHEGYPEVPKDSIGYRLNKLSIKCDYGYAITVHKSQGSEWYGILLLEEKFPYRFEDRKRWIYTGVTRAQKELEIVKM